jgi:hypothetical protein
VVLVLREICGAVQSAGGADARLRDRSCSVHVRSRTRSPPAGSISEYVTKLSVQSMLVSSWSRVSAGTCGCSGPTAGRCCLRSREHRVL